jgi:hypothetical protein
MAAPCIAWLAFLLMLLPAQEAGEVHDRVRTEYYRAVSDSSSGGVPALVSRLTRAANEFPAAPFTARLLETIQLAALLHPGSVPDHAARFRLMQQQSASNTHLGRVAARVAILKNYYEAAGRGRFQEAKTALADPLLEGWPHGLQARADAAFRSADFASARDLALQAIEADPFSPLLAPSYVLLGLCDSYTGDRPSAVRHLQRATAASPLPTVYGRTQDYLAVLFRFVRPLPGPAGGAFDEMIVNRIGGAAPLRDPRSLLFHNGNFVLVDREQILTLSPEGKALETRPARDLEDAAVDTEGKFIYLADNALDSGTGTLARVTVNLGNRRRQLEKLRSLAVSPAGDLLLLDQDAGLFRAPAPSAPALTQLSPARGRLLRTDRHGNIFMLAADQRSISILSGDGKPITSVSPGGTGAKEVSIEYFALDPIGNLYILDMAGTGSIHIFAVHSTPKGLETKQAATIPLEPRPHHKNLRVLAVSNTGEIAVTGRNEDHWVLYR